MQLINHTCIGTTMNAKHLILTLSFALAASSAAAANEHGRVEPSKATPTAVSTSVAIPRVVVTASRAHAKALAQANEAPVPRVVVTAPRQTAGGTGGALPKSALGSRI